MATPLRRCASPRCKYGARWGVFRNFCKRHADELAAIRNDFIAETQRKCPSITNGLKKRQVRTSTCCTVGCVEPRKPPSAFCVVCLAMNIGEDEAA